MPLSDPEDEPVQLSSRGGGRAAGAPEAHGGRNVEGSIGRYHQKLECRKAFVLISRPAAPDTASWNERPAARDATIAGSRAGATRAGAV